ncbi:DUF2059 domain-containing protein [Pseudobacteriovorax antillogorgiicola]|uniref:DUF2059 domain-containing protein n=1 Tax=Pseudobacteriovorax antillogorgiicola TaxID=1513793 RepID=A0A1Y6CFM5_9BACT|nr:DUF2059 domain-containing protein [Pseudobacteriovorax antillogorgiicola]TCS49048.1 uncharacterized protein DUF2059 [Pseudobacteriovorax antillogorgiicola]SMF52564.1 hypothetical protein SAMN06296036_11663 [Pseudobacteriovorax antillogorgiicola]
MIKQVVTASTAFAIGMLVSYGIYSPDQDKIASQMSTSEPVAQEEQASQESVNIPTASLALKEQVLQLNQENQELKLALKSLHSQPQATVSADGASSSSQYRYTPAEDTPDLRLGLAGEYFEVMAMDEQMSKMIEVSFDSMLQSEEGELDAEGVAAMKDVMKKYIAWEKWERSFYEIYAESFTANELQALIDFQKSEVGQAMVEKTPEITAKVMQTMGAGIQENQAKMAEEIEAIHKAAEKRRGKPAETH